jgi:hypothetical protein
MRIDQGTAQRLVFLLVDDNMQGVENADVTTEINVNGQPFQPTKQVAQETEDGWYYVDLAAEETATLGPLVFRANADAAAYEWRDICQVDTPTLAGIDPDQLAQLMREEMEKWAVQIAVPVKLIRAGATG